MNNLVTNFNQIIEYAQSMQVPINSKRGIIREYLQTKFITILYGLPESRQLSFIGGTSLRLLRDLNRFSEDLDFDNLGLSTSKLVTLIETTTKRFSQEAIDVELKQIIRGSKVYFELRFPKLLYQLQITTNPREKLMIKVDSSQTWREQTTEVILLSKYGFIEQILTNTLGQILVQKLTAYVNRRQTQPRDIYDVVWLYAHNARLDTGFMQANDIENLMRMAIEKADKEKVTQKMKQRLEPFLFQDTDFTKLDLFKNVLRKL